jgi:hypothetical protein
MDLPGYKEICRQQNDGSCDAPFGMPTSIYAKSNVMSVVDGKIPSDIGKDPTDTVYVLADTCAPPCLLPPAWVISVYKGADARALVCCPHTHRWPHRP